MRRSSFQTSGSTSRSRASGKSPLISIHDSDDDDVPEESQPPASLSPGMDEETVVVTRKRRRSLEESLPGPSRPRFIPGGRWFFICSSERSNFHRWSYEVRGLPSSVSRFVS